MQPEARLRGEPGTNGNDTSQALLRRVDLFAGLPAPELEALAASARWRAFEKDTLIFLQGDPGSSLYVIESGQVRIALPSKHGKQFLLNVLGPGDFFGDLALLDGESRSADAVAHEDCRALLLDRSDFLHFVTHNPMVATKLFAVLSQRLRRNARIIEGIAFLDVPSRLARVLMELACEHGEPVEKAVVVDARFTQTDLARMVAATRESVGKWLGIFEQQGLIRWERGKLAVLEIEKLGRRPPSGPRQSP